MKIQCFRGVASILALLLAAGCAHSSRQERASGPPISGILQTAGGPLKYEVAGSGHPLVLIHAGIVDHRMWDGQFEVFSRSYRVVRYDTRGFGASTVDEGHEFSNREDLAELMDHLDMPRACLLGCSRGGQIATDFTLERPERVDALILVGAGIGGDHREPTPEEEARWARAESLWNAKDFEGIAEIEIRAWVDGPGQAPGRAGPRVREQVRRMIVENYQRHVTQGKPVVLDPPAIGRLDEISVPTLVITGDYDEPDVLAAAGKLVSGIQGARQISIPGTAHLPNMEKPEQFNRIVLDFLAGVPRN